MLDPQNLIKMSDNNIQEIKYSLLDANDGPVNANLIIGRSVDLIKDCDNGYQGYEIGKAMYEALTELKENGGYIPSNEFSNARAL